MIEIVLSDRSGIVARAEADDPESAVAAAVTLAADARRAWPIQGYARTLAARFYVDGTLVAEL